MLGERKKPDASAGSEMRRAEWETERDSRPPQNRVCKYYAAVLLHQYLKLDIRSAAKFREASRDARPKARSSTPNKLIIFPFRKVPPSPFIWIKNEAEEVDNGPPAHQQ